MALKAVFIDKDGTLVENVPYNTDPARVRLASGAADAVRQLARRRYRIFIVSNQPGIADGFFDSVDHERLVRHGRAVLPVLEGFYYCAHAPGEGCACRKPACGMLLQAAREHGVELGASWMVGDILDDVEAGRRAGCRTVLVDNGGETEWQLARERLPHGWVGTLSEAAHFICGAM